MWIRSADKTKIINLTNAGSIEIVDKFRRGEDYGIWIDENKIGGYKTFQRSIEVLDEICNCYKSNKNEVFQMPEV